MSEEGAPGWGERSFNPAGCAPLPRWWGGVMRMQRGAKQIVAFWAKWVYIINVID